MGKINLGRVLLGGLVAGVVYNIGEAVLNMVVIGKEIEEMMKSMNLPAIGGEFIAKATVLMFIVGIVTVYLYAAIRPRFGPGVKTAACAGLIVWFLTFFYMGFMNLSMGLFTAGPTWLAIAWELVQSVLAAIAGAWVYKETE
ncbi:MAG: hypothetical protein IPM55_04165 [Acidobacteria bacterium]|nr:hypothetical protein [Acidobacteriota bacterium]